MSTRKTTLGQAVLLGAGPGAEGLLSREGEMWLSRAQVVVYDRLVNPVLLEIAPITAQRIDVGKAPGHHGLAQEKINALLVENVRAGKLVVRLKGGDPLLFGRGGEEADALAKARLPFRIVPGISAGIAAGAYAGISLTDRRCASTVVFVTGHENPAKGASAVDYPALARIDTVVFYMGVGRLAEICRRLIEAGRDAKTPAVAVENATTPRQRTISATLGTLSDRAGEANLQPPAIVIIGAVAETARRRNWFERLPLFGKCVLVTRPRPESSRLATALTQFGAEVIEAPAIEIAPPPDWAHVDAVLRRIGEFDWLVLTSPNGARAVLERLWELGRDARALGGVKIAVVGAATAEVLAEGNLRADLLPEEFTTEALGRALLAEGLAGEKILLARSDLASPSLPETLAAGGAQVEEVCVYRTLRPPTLPAEAIEALRAGRADWITFTSSSTVTNFLALLGKDAPALLEPARLAAIGPVTAEALRAAGLQADAVARPHTADALAHAIVEAY